MLILQWKLPATFVNTCVRVLLNDVGQFALIYVPLLLAFTTAINALMSTSPEWTNRWANWWLTAENLALLSFIQEPPEIGDLPYPSSAAMLLGGQTPFGSGMDAALPTLSFVLLFFLFLLVTVILLINLLIAMLSATYTTNKENAERDYCISFGRLVLRFERLYEGLHRCFNRDTTKEFTGTRIGKTGRSLSRKGSMSRYKDYRCSRGDPTPQLRLNAR